MSDLDARTDCLACRVEGARIETPAASWCRLCGHRAEGGGETAPARIPRSREELEHALGTWASEEGLASADELVEGYFVLGTPEAILAALARGEAVETTFDVVEFLFSSGRGQGGAPAVEISPTEPRAPRAGESRPPPQAFRPDAVVAPTLTPMPASVRRMGGPRDELLALAAVAASDGEASADDLALLAQAAAARGIPPLAPEDIRVRRPTEIDPPPTLLDRERLLEEMFQMAWSDHELDESEVRVVREFARAWGVDPQRVSEWTSAAVSRGSSRLANWIDRVGYFLFPGW